MNQRYNPLIDTPPVTVSVNGRDYKISSDFRVTLAYLRLMKSDESNEEKVLFGLSLYYGDRIAPDDVAHLVEYIGYFIRRGEAGETKESKAFPTFDILEDSGRIFAAFLQIYGINLRKVRMHWWVFSELLEGLPKGTHLADVIEIRGRKFEKWMKPADRNELQRVKDRYRIGEPTDIMDNLFTALKGIAR